ncbi:succinate--CoA ligase subunit alpha [bacterium]|jgi:succinyl-CoA synthetase alpha subunit|nr:succinate--CoA ligase subunit alpha [bacterium]
MSILVNKNSKVLVQGLTGKEGGFHAIQCRDYGTNIVAGVTPGKGGQSYEGVPVFDTVSQAVLETGADVSLIFVPPPFAADAIIEAVEAEVDLVVCITEGIPVTDMIRAISCVKSSNTRLIGPNCPGIITPGEAKIGIMPGFIHKPGSVGVISKSGTLTYEAVHQLTELGIGQSTCIGIGGDPIIGSTFIGLLSLFENDPKTNAVVMIGEIGGSLEIDAADWISKNMSKPVIGFVAGRTAPPGRRMGHAGAIVSGGDETALAKIKHMRERGIYVTETPSGIGEMVAKVLEDRHRGSSGPSELSLVY